jgi:membrane protein implicated in regulation of membrane protease activity
MPTPDTALISFTSAWEVLCLFLIPIGGGIPAGVLLADARHLPWGLTALLYFISDVLLASVLEPVLWVLIRQTQRPPRLRHVADSLRGSFEKLSSLYGTNLGPLALIAVSLGTDPMTGRAVTALAGHGFLSGWAIAISGDMIYFSLIMVSTLWLNSYLGNGTWTTAIILVLMIGLPALWRRFRRRQQESK